MKYVITRGANEFLTEDERHLLLTKFIQRDWGDTCEEDQELNKQSFETLDRIVAIYTIRDTKVFIITDAGHEVTTVLLANEY